MNGNENMNFSIHSNSKGNLLKYDYEKDDIKYFAKTGRLQVRDFPGYWGIESIIEIICHRISKVLKIKTAEQLPVALSGKRFNKYFSTFCCESPDFRNGRTLIYLQSLYIKEENSIDFEKLCRNTGCGDNLINMLAFDLIIMNEDRHNSNIGFLVYDDGKLELSPIYDNGYSLLYDDIKGMMRDFKSVTKHCLCNAPLYQESFKMAEQIFVKMSKIYEPTINLDVNVNDIYEAVMSVKFVYEKMVDNDYINNIPIEDAWWEKVVDFIMWRIEYVRNLRDSVAE